MDEYYQVVQALPQWLARPLGQLPSEDAETVHELRLRLGCAPQFTVQGCSCTPTQLAPELNALQTMQLTPLQMEEILFTLCGGSVHTHQTEIAQGYVTLENGCRAGLGGRFLQNPEQGTVLQELTSVNLRIARAAARPPCCAVSPGSSSGSRRSFRSLMNGGSSLPGIYTARRWMFLPGSPRDKQCRWHCAPFRHR